MRFERVHAITHFNDRPRGGIADFQGRPHYFETEWDDAADDYARTFRLSPVNPDVVALALEERAISERWWIAFREGGTGDAGLPRVLPEDRSRHSELQGALKDHLRIDPQNFVRAQGEFRRAEGWNGIGFSPSEVHWDPCLDGA